ncbi:hypothetical protein [Pseudooceanicola sediminis]|nr:hypothetical protein [Pseudooceanicola sediminis]|tara:strand:- start:37269 stop:37397 length:129 start_codon:yes stop_codon:yes gene_type:complete
MLNIFAKSFLTASRSPDTAAARKASPDDAKPRLRVPTHLRAK